MPTSRRTLLADHIAAGRKLLIVADYDCDGATACAVGLRALAAFGARVDYFVPNRFETGYGLSREVVDLVAPARPDLLITVDNGIASVDGVARARELGIATLITDHHLPGDDVARSRVHRESEPAGLRFPEQVDRGRGRDVLRDARAPRRAAAPRPFRGEAGAEPRRSSSTSSRSARSPTSSGSTATTASSSARACGACAPVRCSRASRRSSASPAATRGGRAASISASRSGRV